MVRRPYCCLAIDVPFGPPRPYASAPSRYCFRPSSPSWLRLRIGASFGSAGDGLRESPIGSTVRRAPVSAALIRETARWPSARSCSGLVHSHY